MCVNIYVCVWMYIYIHMYIYMYVYYVLSFSEYYQFQWIYSKEHRCWNKNWIGKLTFALSLVTYVIKGKWPNHFEPSFLYTKMKACTIRSLRCSELKNLRRGINVAERKRLAFRGTYKNTITHLGRQTESQRQASVCFPGLLFSSVHYGWLQEGPSVHPGQQPHPPAAGGQRLPWTSHSGGEAPESAGEVHLWAHHSRSGLRERDTGQTY